MQLETVEGGVITLRGNIKTVGDYQEMKTHVQTAIKQTSESLTIVLIDSSTITSSVIGHLFKIMNTNDIEVHLKVGNERLYRTLEDLCLLEMFHVSKLS